MKDMKLLKKKYFMLFMYFMVKKKLNIFIGLVMLNYLDKQIICFFFATFSVFSGQSG